MVAEASKAVGIGRRTAYDERQRNEEFALAWADVLEESTEELEQVAVRRAKEGSDTLLIFLLKARRPELYRERYEVKQSAIKVTGPVVIQSDRERALEVARILQEAGALRDPAGIEGPDWSWGAGVCRARATERDAGDDRRARGHDE